VLADHLGASHVLVASPSAFPDDKGPLLSDVPRRHTVDIVWLDDRDLLDPDFVLHPLRYPEVRLQRAERPKGWDIDYLNWVQLSVTSEHA
jgi:hypothetical protein